jgi:hypothetical protein
MQEAGKHRVRHRLAHPAGFRAVTQQDGAMCAPARLQRRKHPRHQLHVLFRHQTSGIGNQHVIIADAALTPPVQRSPVRREPLMVDTARPQTHVAAADALACQFVHHRARRHVNMLAPLIEGAQPPVKPWHEKTQPVIRQVGVVAGVERRHRRHLHLPRKAERAVAGDVGHGDVKQVRPEPADLAADMAGQPQPDAIFLAGGNGKRRHRLKPALVLHCSRLGNGGNHQHLVAMRLQPGHQPVERERHAILDVVVVSGGQNDPQLVRHVRPGSQIHGPSWPLACCVAAQEEPHPPPPCQRLHGAVTNRMQPGKAFARQ